MHHLIISFTHKNTDIATREKLAFSNELAKEHFIKECIKEECVEELVLLSTCNRVEVICFAKESQSASLRILKNLSIHSGVSFEELESICDKFENQSAIHHLFMVASSLDSLVVGETQIAGQLKEAFKFSINKSYCLSNLSRAIGYSFKCAAAVRNATTIGANSVSVASAAVAKAKNIAIAHPIKKALVIGAGEMSELTIKHLIKQKFEVVLASRNLKKAQLLASTLESPIEVASYNELESLLNSIPFLFSATSAPYPIITKEMVRVCAFERFWFDIAVPRDIEDFRFDGVNIYAVDDLQDIVDEHIVLRAEQAKEAFKIVSMMTSEFYKWLSKLEVEPLIKELYQKADGIIESKLQNAIDKKFIPKELEANTKKLAQSVIAQLLHHPSLYLRQGATTRANDLNVELVSKLFSIELKCENYIEEEL